MRNSTTISWKFHPTIDNMSRILDKRGSKMWHVLCKCHTNICQWRITFTNIVQHFLSLPMRNLGLLAGSYPNYKVVSTPHRAHKSSLCIQHRALPSQSFLSLSIWPSFFYHQLTLSHIYPRSTYYVWHAILIPASHTMAIFIYSPIFRCDLKVLSELIQSTL